MVIGDFSSKPSSASSSVTNIKARAQPQQQTLTSTKGLQQARVASRLRAEAISLLDMKYRFHTRRIPTTQSSPAIAVLGNLFPVDQYGDESSKQSSSQSGSPQGTLQLAGSDSMEEDGDDRSE
nr:transcription factor HHO2-like [Ipomoea batatas]